MQKLLFIFCLMAAIGLGHAQDAGSVKGNTVTMKEVAPTWPGCEGKKGLGLNDCFTKKLTQHIVGNYKYPPSAYKKNEQGVVTVDFIINKLGLVEIKKVSGGTPTLQKEAKRNIMSIPKMSKPGQLGGEPHEISYSVPFTFKTGK